MWRACPEYRLSALIAAIDFYPNLLPWGDGEMEKQRKEEIVRLDWEKELMGRGGGEEKKRGGTVRDGVLPGGRDEAMSTPQKQAASWRPPQALLLKVNMWAFRSVSNTKQHALCSLVPSSQRHALATPRTSCGKLKPDNWTAALITVWFCKLLFLIFFFFHFMVIFLSFNFSQLFFFFFKSLLSLIELLLIFIYYLFSLSISSHSKLIWIDLFMWCHSQSNRFHICCWTQSVKTKPYATYCCKLPWIQIISTKKPVRVWSVINSTAVLFCIEIAKHSVGWFVIVVADIVIRPQ